MIYEFRITLKNVGEPVWRDIQIAGNASFYDLHLVIQHTFDWMDSHLHSYFPTRRDGQRVERVEIAPDLSEEIDSTFILNKYIETDEKIADWFLVTKDKANYIYDFGDHWEHEIVLRKILHREKDIIYPRCIDAKNLTPPEDSRGEVIMGEIDLEYNNSKALIAEINAELQLIESADVNDAKNVVKNPWPDTLAKTKEFLQLKPWEIMTDEHIFAVEDPQTGEYLFCSILGQAGE